MSAARGKDRVPDRLPIVRCAPALPSAGGIPRPWVAGCQYLDACRRKLKTASAGSTLDFGILGRLVVNPVRGFAPALALAQHSNPSRTLLVRVEFGRRDVSVLVQRMNLLIDQTVDLASDLGSICTHDDQSFPLGAMRSPALPKRVQFLRAGSDRRPAAIPRWLLCSRPRWAFESLTSPSFLDRETTRNPAGAAPRIPDSGPTRPTEIRLQSERLGCENWRMLSNTRRQDATPRWLPRTRSSDNPKNCRAQMCIRCAAIPTLSLSSSPPNSRRPRMPACVRESACWKRSKRLASWRSVRNRSFSDGVLWVHSADLHQILARSASRRPFRLLSTLSSWQLS